MKKIIFILAAIALLLPCNNVAARKKSQKPLAEHVVFIGLDGWGSNQVKDDLDLMPTVKSLMDDGCYTFTKRSVMPSASAINWASIFMGVPTEMHCYNAWNSAKPVIPAYSVQENGMPVTIYTLLKQQRPDAVSGCVYDWDGIGYVCDTAAMTFHKLFPGVENYANIEKYTEAAVSDIKSQKPAFYTFYIGNVDHTGHAYGWESKEYDECLKHADNAIAMIVNALKDAGIYDDTIIIVTSDHGGKGHGHGNLTLEELETPFVICGKNISNKGQFERFMMQYDVPATIAYALGLQIPEDWRGRPMMEAFKK